MVMLFLIFKKYDNIHCIYNDAQTFNNIQTKWWPLINQLSHFQNPFKIIIIGNKQDLTLSNGIKSDSDYESLVKNNLNDDQFECVYIQTSLTSNNETQEIQQLFHQTLQKIYNEKKQTQRLSPMAIPTPRSTNDTNLGSNITGLGTNEQYNVLLLDRARSNSKSYIDYRLEKKDNIIMDIVHRITNNTPRSTPKVSIADDDKELHIDDVSNLMNDNHNLYKNAPQRNEEWFYSLSNLVLSYRINLMKGIKLWVKLLFYPITTIYNTMIFVQYNKTNVSLQEKRQIRVEYLSADFDIFDIKHRIYFDILSPLIHCDLVCNDIFNMEQTCDSDNFMRQSPRQIFVRFVVIANGLLLYALMWFNLVWFCLHFEETKTKIHYLEVIGGGILFLILITIVSVWVAVEYKFKKLDKFKIGECLLCFSYNDDDDDVGNSNHRINISNFLDIIKKQIEVESDYKLNCILLNIVIFIISFIYSLLPSLMRCFFFDSLIIPTHLFGTWFIGILTNIFFSFIFIKISVITISKSCDDILHLMTAITDIISTNRAEYANSGQHLPFLSMAESINITSWTN